MEAHLGQIFERILRRHLRPRRHVEPVDQPGQHEAQRRAARQNRQRLDFGSGQRPAPLVAADHRHALRHVERAVGLEAPGVEADAEVVGEEIVAGEIEVDQAGQLVAEEEHVVGKQVGVDDAARQAGGPDRLQRRRVRRSSRARGPARPRRRAARRRRPAAASLRCERVGAGMREVGARLVHARQRLADLAAMDGLRPAQPEAVEKGDDRRGAAAQAAERLAVLRPDRLRADDAARGEMLHQADEERQVALLHPLLVEGKDELAGSVRSR